MLKGFFGALIAAIILFAAGGVTIAIFGKNDVRYTEEFASVTWGGGHLIDESVSGEKTWYFDTEMTDIYGIVVNSSDVKTYIEPSADNRLSVRVQTDVWRGVSVKAENRNNECLELNVSGEKLGGFISFGSSNGTVTICVPDKIYANLGLNVGSGLLEARGIKAASNMFNVGSGRFEFEQSEGFTASSLDLDMGSGSVKIANAAAESFKIVMGSGNFDISGLTGTGRIEIGSGSGTAEFAKRYSANNIFDLGSGKLTVYIPDDTKADLYADIGSGTVSVNCCGISQTLHDDRIILLNGGSNNALSLYVYLGSGKVDLRNASEYKRPDMFSDFPNTGNTPSGEAVAEQDNNSGFGAAVGGVYITEYAAGVIPADRLDAELISSVTTIEADS